MQQEIDFDSLLKQAAKAAEAAYAPYSNYKVGAAVLCPDGIIFTGCNVENASYGLTICAEQVATVSAVSAGKQEISALAVAVNPTGCTAVVSNQNYPALCGACRQVLSEFCKPDTPIATAFISRLNDFRISTLGELLPEAFLLSKF